MEALSAKGGIGNRDKAHYGGSTWNTADAGFGNYESTQGQAIRGATRFSNLGVKTHGECGRASLCI